MFDTKRKMNFVLNEKKNIQNSSKYRNAIKSHIIDISRHFKILHCSIQLINLERKKNKWRMNGEKNTNKINE